MDETLQTKYPDLTAELIDFDFCSNKIKIQATIFKELLEIDEEKAIKAFEGLCRSFSEVCC